MASSAYRRERLKLGNQHHDKAEQLARAGQLNAATEEFRRALIFSPDNTDYRLSLATALLNEGRLNEAQSHLEQLQQEDPNNTQINLALARTAVRQKKWNLAIEYYQRTVYEYWPQSQIPKRHAARWELVDLLAQQNRRNEIVAELIQLYASAPPDVAERLRIGSMLLKYGATSESAQIFQDLVKRAPQNSEVHRGMAQVNFAERDYVAARHGFQRALRINSADTASRDGLAQTNAVIDMNGSLPGISSAERVRRSENLLNRVLADVERCSGERMADRAADFDAARQLLSLKTSTPNDDRTLALQTMAQKLWALRQPLCGSNAAPDKPVELILAGLGNE
jgi:tetratricopeptide (TPR) repeat protein